MALGWWRNWRRRRRLTRRRIPEALWQAAVASLPVLRGLESAELARLRDLATLFLAEKNLDPAGGLVVTPEMGPLIAAQACLPILNLDLDYYRGWRGIILYPAGFLAQHQYTDANGLVHNVHRPLIGEAWDRGPVVLSWADVLAACAEAEPNVVIHEMAHKLDLLNGAANGLPPLHRGMAIADWSRAFSAAYEDLRHAIARGAPTVLDPYAAEEPGEFFAVASEVFFADPARLNEAYPDLYRQLQGFYRQDPLEYRTIRMDPTTGI